MKNSNSVKSKFMTSTMPHTMNGLPAPGSCRLPPSEVQVLRQAMIKACDLQPGSALERFVKDALADAEIVESYFFPRIASQPVNMLPRKAQVLLPIEHALRAAHQAKAYGDLLPQERSLAFVAGLLYSCGVFHCTNPLFRPPGRNWAPSRSYAKKLMGLLLEDALLKLHSADAGLGQTLAAVLGVGDAQDCHPDQVARIGTAVYLANFAVTQMGLGV
jgi:hypothetical protein